MPRRPTAQPLRALPAVAEGDLAMIIPKVPSALSEKSKEAWVRLWSSPLRRVLDPLLDVDTIEMLLRMRDERDTEFRMGKRQRVVMGSQGQPVINPALSHAMVLQKEIRAIEGSLGLNPSARLKLGILLGDATRSIGDINAEFEQGELGDVDLGDEDQDDAPAARRRSG